jgi:hypothetical protein
MSVIVKTASTPAELHTAADVSEETVIDTAAAPPRAIGGPAVAILVSTDVHIAAPVAHATTPTPATHNGIGPAAEPAALANTAKPAAHGSIRS